MADSHQPSYFDLHPSKAASAIFFICICLSVW